MAATTEPYAGAMQLTQGQLELIAQIAPVFMLVIVVERRDIGRLMSRLDRINKVALSRPGDTPRLIRWMVQYQRTSIPTLAATVMVLLGLVTIIAIGESGDPHGLETSDAKFIWVVFCLGILFVVILGVVLSVEAAVRARHEDEL